MAATEEIPVSYEDLALIEDEFDQIDSEISTSKTQLLLTLQYRTNTPS